MNFLNRHRIVLALAGAAVALAAGLAVAWLLVARHRGERSAPPPASQAGLVIDSSGAQGAHVDTTKPLRCFVAGQFVGELPLADCAKRNGVATDAVDVGADPNGGLAADQGATAVPPAATPDLGADQPEIPETPAAPPAPATPPTPSGPSRPQGPAQATDAPAGRR
ncbi:hypothetical protein [Phenylobacterium sp.]|uniref:hypothetical protein n=1 Tax=Phenylobacterium sp. TaxID=1871053 RepID=UPI00120901E9|nr:hypothetical protein [Phenylobacterium sp.]THD58041.1 MAG: hypothetical protein E8A49_20415 [Phenylobacterium sp.]